MTSDERKIGQNFELEDFHRNVPDDELLRDVARVAQQLGKSKITYREYNLLGQFNSSTISARFGGWLTALEKSGLERTINRNIAVDDLFQNIVEVWGKIGRQPKFRDLNHKISKYSSATYAYRFGGWRKALQNFVLWSRQADVSDDEPQHAGLLSRRTPRNPNWRLRAQVLMRDGATCRMCGASPQTGARLHVDHVKPWSRGGETMLENLQILCDVCNIGKSDIDLP
jgi:hypothetical protein